MSDVTPSSLKTPLSESVRMCTACGAGFSNDVQFCPTCGEVLQAAEARPDPLVNTTIDNRYRVVGVLGEGGMGIVYQVTHLGLQKPMALKLLRGHLASDTTVVDRFVREAQAATAIGHPNIVSIHDFGRLKDGAAYFVMEYLAGESLTALIRRGRLGVADIIPVAEQIASALSAAHQRGVIHRDLKPDNVQLISRGDNPRFVKVLDFGVAKVGGASSKLTRTGTVFGTPHYISPEQASGQSVDARTDIYALGVILYEMCTGEVPFDGDTFMGILSKHMFDEPPRPTSLHPDAVALEPVILKALAKRPEDRYESMDALLIDLALLREGRQLAPFSAVAPPRQMPAPMPPNPIADVQVPSTKTPLVVLGILFSMLLLGGIGGAWLALGKQPEARTATNEVVAPPVQIEEAPTPEAPPSPSPPQPEPEAPPAEPEPVVEVRLESDPPGALVLINGDVIGNTPLSLPRPEGDAQELAEIQMMGYRSRRVSLSSASTATIRVTLERRRSRSGANRPVMRNMEQPASSDPVPMNTEPSPMLREEVVDPWESE
ncbi:MAG: serine/threonine-protein kinase [Myxococcota bacterium]